MEKIRLRTVRPFVMKEIVLSEEPQFAKKASDKSKDAVMNFLRKQVFPHFLTPPFMDCNSLCSHF